MNESDNKLAKWMSGELEDKDLQGIASERDIAEYKKILGQLENWEPIDRSQPFDIDQFINERQKKKSKRFTFKAYSREILAAAAILTLLLTFIFIFKNFVGAETQYVAGVGESKEFTLPDQTKVHLAANSKLSFNNDGWKKNKIVKLEGRAYFDVKVKGKFAVMLEKGKVEVLGTRFEVHEFNNMLSVSCYEGVVKAYGANNESELINANESVLFEANGTRKKTKFTTKEPSWLKGVQQFNNVPLIQVIDALESQFGLKIEFSSGIDNTQLFTGYFPNDDEQLALKLVFEPFNLEFEEKEGSVILLKKKN